MSGKGVEDYCGCWSDGDDLDATIARRTARNPEFPALLEQARQRREPLPEDADAGLRVNGVVVFSDNGDEIEAHLAAELAFDEARTAVYAALCEVVPYIDRREVRERAQAAIERYDRARAAYPWQIAE